MRKVFYGWPIVGGFDRRDHVQALASGGLQPGLHAEFVEQRARELRGFDDLRPCDAVVGIEVDRDAVGAIDARRA